MRCKHSEISIHICEVHYKMIVIEYGIDSIYRSFNNDTKNNHITLYSMEKNHFWCIFFSCYVISNVWKFIYICPSCSIWSFLLNIMCIHHSYTGAHKINQLYFSMWTIIARSMFAVIKHFFKIEKKYILFIVYKFY